MVLALLALLWPAGCKQKSRSGKIDFSRSNTVSVALGETASEHGRGLEHVYWEKDGLTTTSTVDSLPCRHLEVAPGTRDYFYFIIDPAFKKGNAQNVILDVEYFDGQAGTFGAEFDASKSEKNPPSAYASAGLPVRLHGSKTWQVAGFRLENATFRNAQNSRADFRLWAKPPGLFVRRVTVTREADVRTAAPPFLRKRDFSKASTVRIALGIQGTEQGEGLRHIYYQDDGRSITATLDGVPCRYLRPEPGRFAYLYFAVDPSFKKRDVRDALIEVEYFDDSSGAVGLEFDASKSLKIPNPAYASAGSRVRLRGSQTWQTTVFRVRHATFNNAQNSGADFRLCISPPELYLRRVSLTRGTGSPKTVPGDAN